MKLKAMVFGEFSRLAKYNLFTASLVVAFIWIGLGVFLDAEQMIDFLPFVFFMEASAMTALLVGAEMFYEKKEHTISSMLISPITQIDYILSKIFTHLINIIIIFLLISVGLYFVNDMVFNYGWLLISTVIVTAFYVGVGLILSYVSKDFTALLVNYMFVIILIMLPSLLVLMNVIDPAYASIVKYMPSEVTIRLLSTSINTTVDLTQFLLDGMYMVGFGLLMYRFLVIPGFKKFATEYLGV